MPSMPKFSYNVTRDYPYKWFTPAAIFGGMLLTALFSAINFFSTAYNMVSVTTNDPKDIESGPYGGSYAHFFASKVQPKCDDAVLAIGSSFRTNQSIFEYQITPRLPIGGSGMTFHNELIDWCSPYQVTLSFSTFYDRPASQINISAWGLVVTVDLNCDIRYHGVVSPQRFNLQTQIDLISSLQNGGQYLKPAWDIGTIDNPASTWAQVLMLAFWQETITAMMNQTNTFLGSEKSVSQHNLSGGYVQLVRSNSTVAMRDDHYFDKASWVFFDAVTIEKHQGTVGAEFDQTSKSYVYSTAWPQIWAPVDRLAKAAISNVYLDLGMFPSDPQWNSMISNVDDLRFWSTNLSTIVEQTPVDMDIAYMDQLVTVTDYDAQQALPIDNEYKLGTLPDPPGNLTSRATISTTYMCQQPQLKPGFNIFVSILVADLVFLRTAWSLYNFIVAYFLKSRHPDANICDECLARKEQDDVEVRGREKTAHAKSAWI